MPRSRNIKPGFPKNEVLAELSAHIRLLFIQLPMLADREGRLEDRPKRIWVELFPYEPELSIEIDEMLNKLQARSFITRYQVNHEPYIQITNFTKHQSPHHKEVPSVIPPFILKTGDNINHRSTIDQPQPKHEPSINQASRILDNPAALIPDSFNLIPDSLNPESGGDDPNFKNLKYEAQDVIDICTLITTRYKNTQFSNEVMPHVHNLLPQISKEIIIKAINNTSQMFENNNRPHDKRPGFAKQFNSVAVIKEQAERAVAATTGTTEEEAAKTSLREMMRRETEKIENRE